VKRSWFVVMVSTSHSTTACKPALHPPSPTPPPPAVLPPGSAYHDLKAGRQVLNTSGVEVPGALAVAPVRPGRTMLLLPSLRHPQALLAAAQSAGPLDVVVADVHEAYSSTGPAAPAAAAAAAAGGGGGGSGNPTDGANPSTSSSSSGGDEARSTQQVVQLLQPLLQAAAAGWPVRNLVLQGCVGVPQRREFGVMARMAQRSGAVELRQPIESPSTTGDEESGVGLTAGAVQSRVKHPAEAGLTGRLAAAVEALEEGELLEELSRRYQGPAVIAEDGMTLVLEEHRGLEPAVPLDAEGYAELAEVKRQTELLTILNRPSQEERQQQRRKSLRELGEQHRGGAGGRGWQGSRQWQGGRQGYDGGSEDGQGRERQQYRDGRQSRGGGRGGSGGWGGRQRSAEGRGGGGRGGSAHANGGRGFRGGGGGRGSWQGSGSSMVSRPPAEVGQ
jgi:hypothetical protein